MPEPEVVAVPSVGQLVDVRSRRYVVTDIRRSALGASPAYEAPAQHEHLVTLSSVDDEGAGQALEVVWEIEPGARAFDRGALPEPTSFDEPAVFDAFLDAVRWGAISSADRRSLQAPFRSGIELEDYQLDPLARCLRMPRANLLLADDVGLGKTIEAGLVFHALMLRHRVRSVLDGFCWHTRTFCLTDYSFKDFLLSRIIEACGTKPSEGAARSPKLSARSSRYRRQTQPHSVVESDNLLRGGKAKIPVRKALLDYALKRLGLDTDPNARRPADQQIVLLNRGNVLGGVLGSREIGDHQ